MQASSLPALNVSVKNGPAAGPPVVPVLPAVEAVGEYFFSFGEAGSEHKSRHPKEVYLIVPASHLIGSSGTLSLFANSSQTKEPIEDGFISGISVTTRILKRSLK